MANALSSEELEFVQAIEKFKKEKSKTFLSWSEVLGIFKELGYRKSQRNRRKSESSSKRTSSAKGEKKSVGGSQ